VNIMKPNYCIKPDMDECIMCHLCSYGQDCHNNPIIVEDLEDPSPPSNWDLAPKHGLLPMALGQISGLLPAWVIDLDPDKIGDLIWAMECNHQAGRRVEADEINDFLGVPFWTVDWDATQLIMPEKKKEGA
jgi:hypothetical protein